jgi:hypothetical protein
MTRLGSNLRTSKCLDLINLCHTTGSSNPRLFLDRIAENGLTRLGIRIQIPHRGECPRHRAQMFLRAQQYRLSQHLPAENPPQVYRSPSTFDWAPVVSRG